MRHAIRVQFIRVGEVGVCILTLESFTVRVDRDRPIAAFTEGNRSTIGKTVVQVAAIRDQEEADIAAGEALFEQVGCASCHMPSLTIDVPIYSEPSQAATHQPSPLPPGLT